MDVRLTKWYVDAVAPTGRAGIAYWAELRIGAAGFTWHAITEYPVDAAPTHDWRLAGADPPAATGRRLSWTSAALRCSVTADASDAPLDLALLESPAGDVRWHGATRAARVLLERAGAPALAGTGYAERLTMTLPPWRLPADRVLWGRWIADDLGGASTWFRWDGAHPLALVVEDGAVEREAAIGTDAVTTPRHAIRLPPGRTLEHRALREIVAPIPGLGALVPDAFLALAETKWLVRATRRARDGREQPGWALHEEVRLR